MLYKTLTPLLFLAVLVSASCSEPGVDKKSKHGGDSAVTVKEPYTAKTACILSQIAYSSNIPASVSRYLPGWKVVWEANELNGNHAFIATNDTIYGMGIRGSLIDFSYAAFQNWIYQDLNIASLEKWNYTNDSSAKARVSEGAWQGFSNLTTMVDKTSGKNLQYFFDNTAKANFPIIISGHSLGGNLATVTGSWLYQHFKSAGKDPGNINVITFGAPAAGNNYFAEDFNKKFPHSLRFENVNDMVPKFPCRSHIDELGKLFNGGPDATKITVGYNNMNITLSKVFTLTTAAMLVLEFKNSYASYTQTNSSGIQLNVPASGKNTTHDIGSWFAEAAYHHSMSVYARQIGADVVSLSQ